MLSKPHTPSNPGLRTTTAVGSRPTLIT